MLTRTHTHTPLCEDGVGDHAHAHSPIEGVLRSSVLEGLKVLRSTHRAHSALAHSQSRSTLVVVVVKVVAAVVVV